MIDKEALAVLKKSQKHSLSEKEIQCCVKNMLLSPHEPLSHEEMIHRIKMLAEQIPLETAAIGFLYSISSGDLRYRTALSSLIWAKALPDHECVAGKVYGGSFRCKICGAEMSEQTKHTDFDIAKYGREKLFPSKNFMDICCAGYVLNDLECFSLLPSVQACDRDFQIINRILGLSKELSPTNKITALLKLIPADKSLELSAANAYSVLGVLASCGVFDTPQNKSYASGFVNCCNRGFEYETDIYYPLNFWRGKNGIHYDAIKAIFGENVYKKINENTAVCGETAGETPNRNSSRSKAEAYFTDREHIIDLDDRQRYYYGLSPLNPNWDREVRFSATHQWRKRTEIFFEGDVVKKLICEGKVGEDGCKTYLEADMNVATKDRKRILPKTDRGRSQTLTPSLLQTPAYMLAQLHVGLDNSPSGESSYISCFNSSNDLELPLPHQTLRTKEDFAKYTEEYILSCPEHYHLLLDNYIHKKHVTVKFNAGDIFRVQISPTLYCYALILGKVRQIEKWQELPAGHPMRKMMAQPIICRQYAIITENPHMTADELREIPLLDMQFAQDNEIFWGTYPIVCSKKLEENDIDLGFGLNSRLKTVVWGFAMHTFDEDECGIFHRGGKELFLCYNGITKTFSMTYGVSVSIRIETNRYQPGIIQRPETAKDVLKKTIARHFGFPIETACDEFAEKFGGITRRQYIELAERRKK